ncbi:DUF4339 domain-containing protein [Marinicauda salina]|jgi:hypothetical protein|nr:DUF4339 domain-containing protein [Marinicauda salina]
MSWYVKVEGRVYGPYTPAQMQAFVGEGRVAAHSHVSENRETGFREASSVEQFSEWFEEARQGPEKQRPEPADARTANFVVIAMLGQESRAAFEAALADFGEHEEMSNGVWLLRGATSAAILRNELSHLLDRDDRLLVVDASRDRAAWFNLGRDADQRIRDLWARPQ